MTGWYCIIIFVDICSLHDHSCFLSFFHCLLSEDLLCFILGYVSVVLPVDGSRVDAFGFIWDLNLHLDDSSFHCLCFCLRASLAGGLDSALKSFFEFLQLYYVLLVVWQLFDSSGGKSYYFLLHVGGNVLTHVVGGGSDSKLTAVCAAASFLS